MTKQGILHYPRRTSAPVLQSDLLPAPGSTAGRIYDNYPPEAVARLRATLAQQATRQPWKRATEPMNDQPDPTPTAAPETPTTATPTAAPETPNTAAPTSADTAAPVLPFPTMHDCPATDNMTRNRFIMEHFPAWYDYWQKVQHTMKFTYFLGLISLPPSTWHSHRKRLEMDETQAKRPTAVKPKQPTPRPKIERLPTAAPPQPTHGRFDQSPRPDRQPAPPAQYAALIERLGVLVSEIRAHGIQITVEVTYTTKL